MGANSDPARRGDAPSARSHGGRGARGTFFVLGWVAKYHPQVVREIVAGGHEVASHGWGHERVTTLTPRSFVHRFVTRGSILEDLSGEPVFGYRAPSFSIVRGGEWALDILLEEGYRYDSSLLSCPSSRLRVRRRVARPARPGAPRGALGEFPPATLQYGPAVIPAGGGAYFRLLPYMLTAGAIASAERRGVPGTFYIHPWELDPDQPRLEVPGRPGFGTTGACVERCLRLRKLLSSFEFQPIAETLALRRAGGPRGNPATACSAIIFRPAASEKLKGGQHRWPLFISSADVRRRVGEARATSHPFGTA